MSIDFQYISSTVSSLLHHFIQVVTNANNLIEVGIIIVGILLAYLTYRPIKRRLHLHLDSKYLPDHLQWRLIRALLSLFPYILAIILLQIGSQVHFKYAQSVILIDTAVRLLTAWVIIKFTSMVLRKSSWSPHISLIVWMVATLHILDLLVPTINLMDQIAIDIGGWRISLWLIIKGVIVFTLLFKLAFSLSRFLEKRILKIERLTSSSQLLLSKGLKVTLIAVAALAAFSSLGFDLSVFAFIGGATGIGIGFGLQKVVSNLVSGLILLLDHSIKPGDVIEIGSTYGRIHSLGARYVSVQTRDATEYLIPNEDLITNQVINWSFTDKLIRLRVTICVSNDSEIEKVMSLMAEAVIDVPRIIVSPKPICLLKELGHNAIEMELRFWISDPENGIANVSSAVRIAVLKKFKKHHIKLSIPQQEIYIKAQPS